MAIILAPKKVDFVSIAFYVKGPGVNIFLADEDLKKKGIIVVDKGARGGYRMFIAYMNQSLCEGFVKLVNLWESFDYKSPTQLKSYKYKTIREVFDAKVD